MGGGRHLRRCAAPAAAVFATFALAALPACRILPLKQEQHVTDASRSSFDAASFVRGAWEPRVLPYFQTKATDLGAGLDGIAADYDQTASRHGRRHGDVNGAVSFAVQGSGLVTAVTTESRAGTATLAVATASGTKPVTLQIGPVVITPVLLSEIGP